MGNGSPQALAEILNYLPAINRASWSGKGAHAVSRQCIFSICVTCQDVMQVTLRSALHTSIYIHMWVYTCEYTRDGKVGSGNSQYHVLNGLWGWGNPAPVIAVALLIYATFPHICLPLTFCFVACQPANLVVLVVLIVLVVPVASVLVRCLLCVSSSLHGRHHPVLAQIEIDWKLPADAASIFLEQLTLPESKLLCTHLKKWQEVL